MTNTPDNWTPEQIRDNYAEATNYYAGPFCGCGDYSCASNNDPNANCSSRDDYVDTDYHYYYAIGGDERRCYLDNLLTTDIIRTSTSS